MTNLNGNQRLESYLEGGKKLRKFIQVFQRNHLKKDKKQVMNEETMNKY